MKVSIGKNECMNFYFDEKDVEVLGEVNGHGVTIDRDNSRFFFKLISHEDVKRGRNRTSNFSVIPNTKELRAMIATEVLYMNDVAPRRARDVGKVERVHEGEHIGEAFIELPDLFFSIKEDDHAAKSSKLRKDSFKGKTSKGEAALRDAVELVNNWIRAENAVARLNRDGFLVVKAYVSIGG